MTWTGDVHRGLATQLLSRVLLLSHGPVINLQQSSKWIAWAYGQNLVGHVIAQCVGSTGTLTSDEWLIFRSENLRKFMTFSPASALLRRQPRTRMATVSPVPSGFHFFLEGVHQKFTSILDRSLKLWIINPFTSQYGHHTFLKSPLCINFILSCVGCELFNVSAILQNYLLRPFKCYHLPSVKQKKIGSQFDK